ncbi:monooxygenase, FAD-binding protein [Agrobacterium vitis]|uniref:Monooxygenase, FAD-binding protein n=1 Tax=Agrobacterium vitis TaxID=373 RepID=A0A6L6VRB0_AGRVI|nr:FAD-dependent monooxygenase [Agrobacterium vitis]MUZ76012.1 monooxygenase, FAD-binding protein [Agrobacterium vitis]
MTAYERKRCSVLIVGAGSTGMAAALELCRHGVIPVLVDGSPRAQRESRGTGLQSRTLELLDIHGVSDRLVETGTPISAFVSIKNQHEIGRIDFSLIPSRYSSAPALPQYRTEGVLRERLAEYGVVPMWDHRINGLVQTEDSVLVTLENAREIVEIEADYVIGCDGARSTTRKLISMPFDGKSYPEGWGLLDVTLKWDLSSDEVRVYRLDGPQQFVVTPLGGTNYRVQLDNRPEELAGLPPTLEEMREAFTRYTGMIAEISDPVWASAFNIHRRQAIAYRSGRVFIGGDAAHIHTPAGGQGLNTGVQDGLNIGWKLAMVVNGHAKADLLDTYEQERQPIAAGVLELAERLARNPDGLLTRRDVSPIALATQVSQLLVNYRDGPLGQALRGEGQLGAGDRVPDVEINGESIYRAARAPEFILALFGSNVPWKQWLDLPDDLPLQVWTLPADSALARALGGVPGAALIRPDGYLGLVADGAVDEAARMALEWLAVWTNVKQRQIA